MSRGGSSERLWIFQEKIKALTFLVKDAEFIYFVQEWKLKLFFFYLFFFFLKQYYVEIVITAIVIANPWSVTMCKT